VDSVNSWGAALAKLRCLVGVTGQQLGDKVGLTRAAISLYEKHKRDPDSQTVRSLNSALARFAELPELSEYLGALGILDGLLPPQDNGDADFGFLALLVAEFDPYFESGALRAIVTATAHLDQRARLNIARKCAIARGQELVHWLAGQPPKSVGLAEFLSIFRDAGAPLDGALKWDEALVRRFLIDRFEKSVCRAIAAMKRDTPTAPLVAARVILNAFEEVLDSARDPKFTIATVRRSLLPRSSTHTAAIRTRLRRKASKENRHS
jgi:transcriptional regulator with XRE-family HTH domain